jgi:hypothetical protein
VPGGYVVRDANGQALAYIYSRENESEARQAKMLTKDNLSDSENCVAALRDKYPTPTPKPSAKRNHAIRR